MCTLLLPPSSCSCTVLSSSSARTPAVGPAPHASHSAASPATTPASRAPEPRPLPVLLARPLSSRALLFSVGLACSFLLRCVGSLPSLRSLHSLCHVPLPSFLLACCVHAHSARRCPCRLADPATSPSFLAAHPGRASFAGALAVPLDDRGSDAVLASSRQPLRLRLNVPDQLVALSACTQLSAANHVRYRHKHSPTSAHVPLALALPTALLLALTQRLLSPRVGSPPSPRQDARTAPLLLRQRAPSQFNAVPLCC